MQSQRRYALMVSATGIGLLVITIILFGIHIREPWWRFIVFLFCMILSELNIIPLNQGYLTLEFGLIFSAVFIFGIIPAGLMKALSTLFSQLFTFTWNELHEKEKPIVISFNIGQYLLSFYGAVGACLIIKSLLESSGFISHKLVGNISIIVGIIVYFIINNILVSAYFWFKNKQQSLFKHAASFFKHDIITYLIAVPAGIIIVEFYKHNGFYYSLLIFVPYLVLAHAYRLYKNVVGTNSELKAIYDVAATMVSTLDADDVLDIIMTSVQNIAPWDTACLYVYQKDALVPAIFNGFNNQDYKDVRIKLGEGIVGNTLLSGKGEMINNYTLDNCSLPSIPPDTRSILTIPIITNNEPIGAISLSSKKKNAYTQKHFTLMSILASQAAIAIVNARLFDSTVQMAITDGLTKLYNYRYIYEEIQRQIKKISLGANTFSIVMMDIDHFKSYNDIYGHLVGDEILKELAKLLKKNVRENDVVGRYGGEEFVIVLPNIASKEAVKIAERIRQTIEQTALARTASGEGIYITISAGVACYPDDATTVDDLVNKADKAMLLGAKQKGRNKVVMFENYMLRF